MNIGNSGEYYGRYGGAIAPVGKPTGCGCLLVALVLGISIAASQGDARWLTNLSNGRISEESAWAVFSITGGLAGFLVWLLFMRLNKYVDEHGDGGCVPLMILLVAGGWLGLLVSGGSFGDFRGGRMDWLEYTSMVCGVLLGLGTWKLSVLVRKRYSD